MYEVIFIGNYGKSMNVKEHQSYEHDSEGVMKNFVVWFCIPVWYQDWRDIAVIDKTKNSVKTVDVAILGDIQMNEGEVGKIEK